jgi:heme-degrading monooxygenase HmoA
MHARSTTFDARPGSLGHGVAFVKNEAAPELNRIEGCRGLSMLVDRETGQCILTSSWESEAALHASAERLVPIRDRARELLGGSVRVDDWEVAVMRRTHHGECCRVTWLQGDVDAMAETFRTGMLPRVARSLGFGSASLLVNRSTGLGCATTTWETRAAMEASRSALDDMRSRGGSARSGPIVDVREFDLAYAHLHIPEMA